MTAHATSAGLPAAVAGSTAHRTVPPMDTLKLIAAHVPLKRLGSLLLATVVLLSIYLGAETSAPADGAREYSAARSEWYFLFLFQFLFQHLGDRA